MLVKPVLILLLLWSSAQVRAQTIGGAATFTFLKLPASTLQAAAGGQNISYQDKELTLIFSNPALIRPEMNSQIYAGISIYPGDIRSYALSGSWHSNKLQTSFGAHILFINYGNLDQTDAAGNRTGYFRPSDYVLQVSASRSYLEHWYYGLNVKFIQSNYGTYKANGLAADFGLNYIDSGKGLSVAIVARNMGIQAKGYTDEREELPFDLLIGITKKMKAAPFAISVTGQHMHRFDINYYDDALNRQELNERSNSFFIKAMNHLIFTGHVYIGTHIEGTIGYNVLQRYELNSFAGGNGLTGVSAGLKLSFQAIQISYARQSYQRNIASNSIGIGTSLDKFASLLK